MSDRYKSRSSTVVTHRRGARETNLSSRRVRVSWKCLRIQALEYPAPQSPRRLFLTELRPVTRSAGGQGRGTVVFEMESVNRNSHQSRHHHHRRHNSEFGSHFSLVESKEI
ncbi:hypothetical protein E2C01_052445 [Portunus trituberculatus]|uniref:Uncharacterized protein n=1 Tax=Portunus trituberculatus TaxID=210409 RepID=A0A5B7GDQ3_PORTR|nr:hypothetical protein [Portunus trituberculatus]